MKKLNTKAVAQSRSRAVAQSRSRAVAQSRSRAVASTLLLIAAAFGSDRITAQVIDPPRENYVFHIYVDPMFGDDTRATARNPSTTAPTPPPVPQGPLLPLDRHPEPANPTKPITGFLQHAPYPFKTLTGASGALAWIDANFRPGTGLGTFFPWQHPDNTKVRKVTQVVVHCLPGLYGPYSEPALPRLDPASGLPFNGEVWPAIIRDHVSIQGTSALDTIFDARGGFTHVLEVSEDRANLSSTGQYAHTQSFIDSVTVRGARVREEDPARGEGAGIYVHPRRTADTGPSQSRIFITNCVITNNIVGIALDSYLSVSSNMGARPRIINNTIAWNACGLWCGSTNAVGISAHAPTVINNIFDSGSPPGNVAGISGFEGLHAQDKQVISVGGWVLAGGTGVDFNAWEVGFVNLGGAIGPGFPGTNVGHTIPLTGPRVDIAPFTRAGGARPGSLYINDIFRNSPEGGTGLEYSAHDFRLAPNVSLTTAPPGATVPPLRNLLINMGLDDVTPPSGFLKYPIVMGNAWTLVEPPGLTPLADEARIDGWDWSGEGFGNNRIYLRPGFAAGSYGPPEAEFESIIDIGFHELGDLTMAGYLVSSRIYTRMDAAQGGVTLPDRGRVFYFNLIYDGTSYPPTSFTRPRMNAPFGQSYYWWPHVQNGGASDANDGNFTKLVAPPPPPPPPPIPTRYALINLLSVGYNSIPRSLQCDFTPHLLPDAHPYWSDMMWISLGSPGDIYAANPW